MLPSDLQDVIQQYHEAMDAFMKGNPEPAKDLYSRGDDVTIANPFGPAVRGWEQAFETISRAATNYREGSATGFRGAEVVTPCDLRVTMTLRPEDGTWKVVHRHADPITSARPAESVIQSSRG